MLFQVLLNIIAFLIKCLVWFVFVLAGIPFGIYMLLVKWFPVFTQDGGFWFWSVFSILSIIGFVVLWRPIMWLVGVLQVLGAGAD
jgi:hypothetical protein